MELRSWSAPDARADGALRDVRVDRDAVRISRRVNGMAMRICAPTRLYQGVALALDATNGVISYRLSLRHADPGLAITLFEAGDDRDICAEWMAWAQFFDLPRLVERAPDRVEPVEPRIGALTLGRARPTRRRNATLTKRRLRFAARRKTGVLQSARQALAGQPGE